MSLLSLPAELLDAVCAFLPHSALAALATTSARLTPIVHRLLYRQVAVRDWKCNRRCVVSLAKNPALANAVRTFDIDLTPHGGALPAYYHLLHDALANMTGATSMRLTVPAELSWILDNASHYPHLRSLACEFPLDHSVAKFLQRCPALQDLQLGGDAGLGASPAVVVSSGPTLPLLRTFAGSCEATRRIVPGCPVSHVYLMEGHLTDAIIAAMAQSTSVLSSLDATIPNVDLDILRSIASNLPDLESLTLSVEMELDPVFLASVADVLCDHKKLRDFEISGIHWAASLDHDSNKRSWQRDSPKFLEENDDSVYHESHNDILI